MILHAHEAGAGAPVVLLHGLFGRATNFATIQKRLAATHRVIALDLRNHGSSPHQAGMTYPVMAADVLETLRASDAWPCALVGHSMGGKVAMAAALAEPGAVSRLLISDIAPVPYPPRFRVIAEAMARLKLEPGLVRAAAEAALAPVVDSPALRGFLLQNLRPGPDPAWKIGLPEIAAGLPDIEDWPELPGTYQGPALFVAGARSDYIRPEDRATIRALFPAARFVTLRHAGHWVHSDDPEGFLAVLGAFLPP